MRIIVNQPGSAWTVALFLVGAAFAQTADGDLRSKIAEVRYSPLAKMARVQGDVRVEINSGVVGRVSGPPLLVPTATESAKAIAAIQGEARLEVTYHFVIFDSSHTVVTPVTVKRGNAVGRVVLRMFGRRTEKVVLQYECQEGVPPANIVKVAGRVIDIRVYGGSFCVQTQTSMLLARR